MASYEVRGLQNASIGGLRLGNLEMGKYKILSEKEINKVFLED